MDMPEEIVLSQEWSEGDIFLNPKGQVDTNSFDYKYSGPLSMAWMYGMLSMFLLSIPMLMIISRLYGWKMTLTGFEQIK